MKTITPQFLAEKPEGLLLQSSWGAALSEQDATMAFLYNVTEKELLLDVPEPQNLDKILCSLNLIAAHARFDRCSTNNRKLVFVDC